MIDLLQPDLAFEPRPTDPQLARYVRSYLILRVFVGALAIVLPFLLVLVDGLVLDGDPFPQGSLSAYYYSGARELFVGALSATAVFLVTYKVAERTLDNTLSSVAGLAVLVVALFPTGLPSAVLPTPLQDWLGESAVEVIHFVAAGLFIVSLAGLSILFGIREGERPPREGARTPLFWRRFHWVCAATIVAALVWIGITELIDWPSRSLLVGEAVAIWAFGASWLMKGLELDTLRRR